MGLYDALGVRPTHLDLQDGGVPFGSLGLRTLVTHNGGALSPANNQLRLAEEPPPLLRFTSLAVHIPTRRAVVATHFLPRDDAVESALAAVLPEVEGAAVAPTLLEVWRALEGAEVAVAAGLPAALEACCQ